MELIALIVILQEANAVGVDMLQVLGHIILLTFPKLVQVHKLVNPTFKLFLQ